MAYFKFSPAFLLACCSFLISRPLAAQVCDSTANIVLFSNYDGGVLNIYVDVNIPNLKIGVVTYEAVEVNIAGPFAGNVTQVVYAGYNSNNNHCSTVIPTTVINGVPSGITSILFAPPATLPDPNGNNSIICAYSCGTGSQGGCNTSLQIMSYFSTTMGGSIYSYTTQYGCWSNAGYFVSAGGNCCPPQPVNAGFTPSGNTICAGECVTFTNQTTGVATSWSWSFPGAQTPSSTLQNPGSICYSNPGVYPVTLTVSNATITDTHTDTIVVGQAFADTVNASICVGDVYTFPDGTTSQANTTHVSNLTGALGCDSIITTNLSVLFVDTSLTFNGAQLTVNIPLPAVQWVNCDLGYAPVAGQTGYSFTPASTGNYAAVLTSGGCTDTSGCYFIIVLGTEEHELGQVMLYPNPAEEELFVKFSGNKKSVTFRVLDVSGRITDVHYSETSEGFVIDTRLLPPGTYLLEAGEMHVPFIRH